MKFCVTCSTSEHTHTSIHTRTDAQSPVQNHRQLQNPSKTKRMFGEEAGKAHWPCSFSLSLSLSLSHTHTRTHTFTPPAQPSIHPQNASKTPHVMLYIAFHTGSHSTPPKGPSHEPPPPHIQSTLFNPRVHDPRRSYTRICSVVQWKTSQRFCSACPIH